MKGRPPNVQPTLAYERRRYLTLVQVLAIEDVEKRHKGLLHLALQWTELSERDLDLIKVEHLIVTLAQHVVEYHRGQA